MKKSRIMVLALCATLPLAGCTNSSGTQIQQQNAVFKQQTTGLQQQANQQDIPGYVSDSTTTSGNARATGNTKTIPFSAVGPANNNTSLAEDTTKGFPTR